MARLIGRTAVVERDFVFSDSTAVGAAAENVIRLAVEGVSRRNARLVRESGVLIESLGATNVKFLNGTRIQREALRHLYVNSLGRTVDLIFVSRESNSALGTFKIGRGADANVRFEDLL